MVEYTCLVCLEKFAEAIELQPCRHHMCQECFLLFPRKIKANTKCPSCRLDIVSFGPDHTDYTIHLL